MERILLFCLIALVVRAIASPITRSLVHFDQSDAVVSPKLLQSMGLLPNLAKFRLPITRSLVVQSFWKFCTEHCSITAVFCAKLQNDSTFDTDVMDQRDFARFEFKMRFGRISYIAQDPQSNFTHWPRGRSSRNFQIIILKTILQIVASALAVKLLSAAPEPHFGVDIGPGNGLVLSGNKPLPTKMRKLSCKCLSVVMTLFLSKCWMHPDEYRSEKIG